MTGLLWTGCTVGSGGECGGDRPSLLNLFDLPDMKDFDEEDFLCVLESFNSYVKLRRACRACFSLGLVTFLKSVSTARLAEHFRVGFEGLRLRNH